MRDRISDSFGNAGAENRKGFTLVELVVIVGVVAVLAAVQYSALASGKSSTRVAMCASNLRQLALASHLYAADYGSKLPPAVFGGSWAWDQPAKVGDTLLTYDTQKRNFYCPGTAPRFTDWENYQDLTLGRNLWAFGAPTFHVVGYIFSYANSVIITSNRNATILPERSSGATLAPQPTTERVLLADATISVEAPAPGTTTYTQRLSYNYTQIAGGFYKQHLSPHLNGNVPAGGNVAFKDGHVAWRKFEEMDDRAPGPGFWW